MGMLIDPTQMTDAERRMATPAPKARPVERSKPTLSGGLVYRINVAMAKLGISRTTLYRLVNSGEITLIKIGARSSGITAESMHTFLERRIKGE
jgi:excisionase family DNA binding protein